MAVRADNIALGDLGQISSDALFHPSALRPGEADIRGLDEFLTRYARRRETDGQDFSYEVGEILATRDHAVAVITLRATLDGRPYKWQQVAVYRIDHGRIVEIWLFEDRSRAAVRTSRPRSFAPPR